MGKLLVRNRLLLLDSFVAPMQNSKNKLQAPNMVLTVMSWLMDVQGKIACLIIYIISVHSQVLSTFCTQILFEVMYIGSQLQKYWQPSRQWAKIAV